MPNLLLTALHLQNKSLCILCCTGVYLTSILLFVLAALVMTLMATYLMIDNSKQQGYTTTFTTFVNGVSCPRCVMGAADSPPAPRHQRQIRLKILPYLYHVVLG